VFVAVWTVVLMANSAVVLGGTTFSLISATQPVDTRPAGPIKQSIQESGVRAAAPS
jgi:hypothetical protein